MAFNIPEDQIRYVKLNAPDMTVEELLQNLNIKYARLYWICKTHKIIPKNAPFLQKVINRNQPQKEKKFERPPARYTNSPSPYGIADELHHSWY